MMTRTLLLVAILANAQDAVSPYTQLQSALEPAERIRACAELAQPPQRSQRAYQALLVAMNNDLSERVRLAAAVAVITYPGGATLSQIDSFLKTEPGAAVRRELLVALSTEPAHFANPDATRIIVYSLTEDQSVEVRIGAAEALGLRGDALSLGAVGRASEKDKNKGVREAARRSMIILSKPPKPKPKPKLPDPPKADAVFGKDSCPRPWGWCRCAGAVTIKPQCLTSAECRTRNIELRRNGLECRWDGHSED